MGSGLVFFISFIALILFYIIARIGKGNVRRIFKVLAMISGCLTIISVGINVYYAILCLSPKPTGDCGLEPGGIANLFGLVVLVIILLITLILTFFSFRIKNDENNTTSTN